jgi:hypothetical protein
MQQYCPFWTVAACSIRPSSRTSSATGSATSVRPAGDVARRPPCRPRSACCRRPARSGGIDALILLRRDVPALVDESDVDTPVPGEAIRAGGLTDLTDHAIVDRGRVVGLWRYDVDADDLVTWLFQGRRPDAALREATEHTRTCIRGDLEDARGCSLDSPKSRAPRIAALRGS